MNDTMRQLSELDASFLYLESDTTPMHIGGLYLFDGSHRSEPLRFEQFRTFLERRLHLAAFFRQKILQVPLNLDRPYWVDDEDFDLDHHLSHISLEGNGSMEELKALAESLLAEPLPRERPLWHVTYIDGLGEDPNLPEKAFAIVARVHHAAVDAFSGEEVMGKLLEYTPDAPMPARHHWQPEASPSTTRLAAQASLNVIQRPFKLASIARDAASATLHGLVMQYLGRLPLSRDLFRAPRTPFNRNLSNQRRIVTQEIELARLKELKATLGADITLNDVVLGVCAEALKRYLNQHEALPERSLVALTPISVRSKSLRRPTGNQMSAMLLSLATDEPDPARRVQKISQNARVSESYQQAIAADRLTELLPPTMLALSARLYSEFQLAQRYKPVFNLPITNVPGPQVPLYLQGARLVRQINSAPLFDGAGLVILAVSYEGSINFNITLCPELIPDGDQLAVLIDESVDAIEEAATNLPAGDVPDEPDEGAEDAALLDDLRSHLDQWLTRVTQPFRQSGETGTNEEEAPVSEKEPK